jgi:hypothetical protein
MEALIVLTDIDLIDKLRNNIVTLKEDYQFSQDDDLHILNINQRHIRVSKISYEDVFDDWLLQKYNEENLTFYAFYYSDIDFLKSILKMINYEKLWINNDFENKNYTYQAFITKINKKPIWDWRLTNGLS